MALADRVYRDDSEKQQQANFSELHDAGGSRMNHLECGISRALKKKRPALCKRLNRTIKHHVEPVNDEKKRHSPEGVISGAASERGSLAVFSKAEILAEEWHHMILKTIRHSARVRAVIDRKAVRDAVAVENFVYLAHVKAQPVFIAYVQRDGPILL